MLGNWKIIGWLSLVKMTFRTDERDQIRKLVEQYGCSPFTGKCHDHDRRWRRDLHRRPGDRRRDRREFRRHGLNQTPGLSPGSPQGGNG